MNLELVEIKPIDGRAVGSGVSAFAGKFLVVLNKGNPASEILGIYETREQATAVMFRLSKSTGIPVTEGNHETA